MDDRPLAYCVGDVKYTIFRLFEVNLEQDI